MESKGIPGCKDTIDWITLFIAFKSVNVLYFPDFFFITNRELQEPIVFSLRIASHCTFTSCTSAWNLSLVSVHCSTQTSLLINHFKSMTVDILAVAPSPNYWVVSLWFFLRLENLYSLWYSLTIFSIFFSRNVSQFFF